MEELSDSVVSGRFRLFPELLCVKAEADPEELKKTPKTVITFLSLLGEQFSHTKTLTHKAT